MASQKIKRALFQILIICLGFGCASSSNKLRIVQRLVLSAILTGFRKLRWLAINQNRIFYFLQKFSD